MSRVFDALRKAGARPSDSAAALVDAVEKSFHPESVSSARVQPGPELPLVFDALRKAGARPSDPSTALSPAVLVDALEKSFQPESFSSARAQLGVRSRLVFYTEPSSPGAERYRLLRHRLNAAHTEANIRTLLITSPGPAEGKSTVALNLAAALAEKENQHVLLLEGDLRCPSLTRALGLKLPSGLTQCERSDVGLRSAIWRVEPLGFYLLPAGKAMDNPAELLGSEWFPEMTAKLAACFDWIIIDAPPVLPVADAVSLKRLADSSIVVARAGRTQRGAVTEAIRILGRTGVLGVLLNGVEKFDDGYNQYYK